MNEVEALAKIQRMSIEEKLAALSPTDKAYISGYIEKAILESRKEIPVHIKGYIERAVQESQKHTPEKRRKKPAVNEK
jgi:hypothetical protein